MKTLFSVFAATAMVAVTLISCDPLGPDEPGLLVPRTVDEDPTLPSIHVNGAMLHSEAYGPKDSAMIVVLHGGPGGDYRYMLRCVQFADSGFRVVFYDQRGSGLSQRFPKSSYTMDVMYDDLAGVIAHYRTSPTQKIFLLGHSWGAMLATAYINHHPADIRGAVLAEPGGLVWQDVLDYVSRARDLRLTSESSNDVTYMDQFVTAGADDQAVLDFKYALMVGSVNREDNPLGDEEVLPMWRCGAVVNTAMFELGNKEKPNWTTNLQQYNTGVLFVYSERNKAYGYEYARKVSSAYPNVELFRVDKVGHETILADAGWVGFFPKSLAYFNRSK